MLSHLWQELATCSMQCLSGMARQSSAVVLQLASTQLIPHIAHWLRSDAHDARAAAADLLQCLVAHPATGGLETLFIYDDIPFSLTAELRRIGGGFDAAQVRSAPIWRALLLHA